MQVVNGVVVAKPDTKTTIVEVVRKIPHPLYKKLLKRSKRYKVESDFDVAIGKKVRLVGIRPKSKHKNFKILEEIK